MIPVKGHGKIFIDGAKSNFYLHEFVAPEIWSRWGLSSLRYIQESIIRASQLLRDKTGLPITICNYIEGGTYRDSGTRILESYERMYSSKCTIEQADKYIKTYSMHKFTGAVDLKIGDLTSHEMAAFVFKNEKELMKMGIRRIENPYKTKGKTRGWLHYDSAQTGLNYILTINP